MSALKILNYFFLRINCFQYVIWFLLVIRLFDPVKFATVALGSTKRIVAEGGPLPWVLDPKHHYEVMSAEEEEWVKIRAAGKGDKPRGSFAFFPRHMHSARRTASDSGGWKQALSFASCFQPFSSAKNKVHTFIQYPLNNFTISVLVILASAIALPHTLPKMICTCNFISPTTVWDMLLHVQMCDVSHAQ